MKFRYIGNPRDLLDLHSEITAFGLTFPLDEPVEVTEPRAVRKLKNNPHFEAMPDGEREPETGADDAVATITPESSPAAPEASAPLGPPPSSPVPRGSRRRS
jgi:hypothetical protein